MIMFFLNSSCRAILIEQKNPNLIYINRQLVHLQDNIQVIILFRTLLSMNRISDRRKTHAQIQVSQDQPNLIRMTTNATNGIINNIPPSNQQLKKIIKGLEQALKEQRQRKMELEQNIKLLQYRGIEKQKQFLKILKQKSKQVYKYSKPTQDSDNLNDLRAVYTSIVSNFELTSNLTNTLIQKKYRQNQSAMERRIGNILVVLQQQIKRCRKMSSDNLQAIKTEVEKALYIVKGIESQNVELMQKVQKQKSKTRLLQQQRKLLLEQLVNKKMLIQKLYEFNKKQSKEYNKIYQENEVKSQSTCKYNSYLQQQQLKTAKKKLKTLESCNQAQVRNIFSTNNIRDTSENNSIEKYFREREVKFDENIFTIKLSKQNQTNPSNQQTNGNPIFQKIAREEADSHKLGINRRNFLSLQKKYGRKKPNKHSLLITSNQSQISSKIKYKNDIQKKNLISCSIPLQQNSNQKTIHHLKVCLEREKKKSYELGKIVSKIRSKQIQINESILQILSQNKSRQIEKGENPENMLKFQAFLKHITDLQNRLAMCENPSVQCGFGDLEIEKLLEDY